MSGNVFSSLHTVKADSILTVPTTADLPTGAPVGSVRYVVADGFIYKTDGATWVVSSGGIGGPGSSTDNAVVRFNGTGGTTVQNSGVIVDDSNNVSGVGTLGLSGPVTDASLTASRAVVTNGSKALVSSATSATEIGYVAGVTSAIQTQIDGKQATGSYITALTGDVTAAGPGSVAATIGALRVTNAMLAGSIAYSKLSLTGAILNADLAGSIAYSKLSLTGAILNADLAGSIAYSKLSLTGAILNADLAGSIAYSKLSLAGSIATADLASGLVVPANNGGTGVANNSAATLTRSGNHGLTITTSGTTSVTLPTSGTLLSADFANVTGTLPIANGGTNKASVTTAPAASSWAGWDANSNLSANNLLEGYATTATAAGTTTLVVGSAFQQFLTGTTTQTVVLPVTSTLALGHSFQIVNLSTGTVTVNSSGSNLVQTMAANTVATVTCILASGTTAASWSTAYSSLSGAAGGAGEKNYLATGGGTLGASALNGSSSASGWGTSGSITVATTTSGLPRANTTKTGILLTGASSTSEYAYYRFVLDDADAGKILKFQFDMEPGTAVASDFEVRVYSNTASDYTTGNTRLTLSTDNSTPASLLPLLTGTYRTTFSAPATSAKYIEVRVKSAASHAHTLVISDVVVGPGVVVQGAAISEWISYTPTGTWVANTTYTGRWRRVGDSMECEVKVAIAGGAPTTADFGVTWASGYTLDTTKITDSATGFLPVCGAGQAYDSGARGYNGTVVFKSSTQVGLCVGDFTATNSGFVNQAVPFTFGASDSVWLRFIVPIAEWAGSGTVNIVQNDVEYAYNTTTSDADDTSAFGYGPAGTAFPSVTTSAKKKRVRFLTPIQATDRLTIEIQKSSGAWVEIDKAAYSNVVTQLQYQNTKTYGIGFDVTSVSSTDIDVVFGTYYGPNGATYDSAGGAWSGIAASYKWRVRKVSGGQAIGFANVAQNLAGLVKSAGQLQGTNTNDDAATGFVGEYKESKTSFANTGATTAFFDATSLTLSAGDWDVWGVIEYKPNGATFSSTVMGAGFSATTGNSGTSLSTPTTYTEMTGVVPTSFSFFDIAAPLTRVTSDGTSLYMNGATLSSTQVLYLKGRCSAFTVATPQYSSFMRARRVR